MHGHVSWMDDKNNEHENGGKKTENNKKGRKKVKFLTFHPKKNRPGVNNTKRADSTGPYYLTAYLRQKKELLSYENTKLNEINVQEEIISTLVRERDYYIDNILS